MKKVYTLIIACFVLLSMQAQVENEIISLKKELDKELIVNLYDKSGHIIQCTHPETNGDFHFSQLISGKYKIVVVNQNGIESEAYCIKCVGMEINDNLETALSVEKLICAKPCIEGYSCDTKPALKLDISSSVLKDQAELKFSVTNSTEVELNIKHTNGKVIRNIPLGKTEAGSYSISFDTSQLKGLYIVEATAGNQMSTCSVNIK